MSSTEINKYKVDWTDFKNDCISLSNVIKQSKKNYQIIYPVPKNGLFVAIELSLKLNIAIENEYDSILNYGKEDVLIVDDLIDSGKTLEKYPGYDKAVLYVKNEKHTEVNYFAFSLNKWIVFPWEEEKDIEDIIIRQLEYIGENPNREGLKDTPKRVIKSWEELYAGYNQKSKDIIKVFKDGVCDQLVLLKDIEFYSTCEHHLLPFFGKIHVGYIPDGKVIGVSKLARLVEIYSRRLQIQERLVQQIADDLEKFLNPLGVMIVCEAQHFCMTSRGVEKQHSKMITSDIKGVFKNKIEARQEFLNLIKG
jgi:GTP cyclohydrolase I